MKNFEPSETWTPQSAAPDLDEVIERAQHELNTNNFEQLISSLKEKVERSENGIVFAVLNGKDRAEYSDTDALVMFNPFANTATPNMLVRSEFIREVAKQANIRDEQGKLKSIIMLASPGLHGSKLQLSREDSQQVRRGNLGPVANELLKAVVRRDFGRIALLGFSQGADLAIAGSRQAYSTNLDVTEVSVGDPAATKNRNMAVLGKDFFTSAPDLEKEVIASGLDALDKARQWEYPRLTVSAMHPINWMLLGRSLGRNSFEYQMERVLNEGRIDKFVIGYGGNSTISRPEAIEPTLARLHQEISSTNLISIKATNKTHAWGDNLTLLAKLYLRALR